MKFGTTYVIAIASLLERLMCGTISLQQGDFAFDAGVVVPVVPPAQTITVTVPGTANGVSINGDGDADTVVPAGTPIFWDGTQWVMEIPAGEAITSADMGSIDTVVDAEFDVENLAYSQLPADTQFATFASNATPSSPKIVAI